MTDQVQNFLDTVVDSTFETKFTPVPAGDYTNGRIKPGSMTIRNIDFKNGRYGKELEVAIIIADAAAAEATGIAEPSVRWRALLDFTRDLTQADMADGAALPPLASGKNKNIRLGNLREALGQNSAPWSFRMLDGAGPIPNVKVKHVADKTDPEKVYPEVAAVSK